MVAQRGVSVLDLLGVARNFQAGLAPEIARPFELAGIVGLETHISDTQITYRGLLQPATELFEISTSNDWIIQGPGLTAGLPFQCTLVRRVPAGGQNLEPQSDAIALDVYLNDVSILIPFLKPAVRSGGTGVTAAHLLPHPTRNDVRLVGTATLRLRADATGLWTVSLIDGGDPFDVQAPMGPVVALHFEPAHFFILGSTFGMTVEDLQIDDSDIYTPPVIMARGQGPLWRGVAIKEASLYLPRNLPLIGDVAVGVKDVLLGFRDAPAGVQGEVFVQFGRTPVSPETLIFTQTDDRTEVQIASLSLASFTNAPAEVQLATSAVTQIEDPTNRPAKVRAHGANGLWRIPGVAPGQQLVTGATTPYFAVNDGDELVFQGVESVDVDGVSRQLTGPPRTITFVEAPTERSGRARIDVQLASVNWPGVLHVSGTADELHSLVFSGAAAAPPALTTQELAALHWCIVRLNRTPQGDEEVLASHTGAQFTLPPTLSPGAYCIILINKRKHLRRCWVTVEVAGQLLVGWQPAAPSLPVSSGELAFVSGGDGVPIAPASIESTLDATYFHNKGRFRAFSGDNDARLNGTDILVPDGAIARTVFALSRRPPGDDARPVTARPPVDSINLWVHYDSTIPNQWDPQGDYRFDDDASNHLASTHDPDAPELREDLSNTEQNQREAAVVRRLQKWLAQFDDPDSRTVYVIGMCSQEPSDDPPGTDRYNDDLAITRAGKGETWLRAAGFGGTIEARGEQQPAPAGEPGDHRVGHVPDSPTHSESVRETNRRVVFQMQAGVPASTPPTQPDDGDTDNDPSLRRIYVPGRDAVIQKPAVPAGPDLPYRVVLRAVWDSPSQRGSDAYLPTLVEFTVDWQSEPIALPPGVGSDDTEITPARNDGATTPETFQFLGRATYDNRSGQTGITLALDGSNNAEGLAHFSNDFVAAALAFGPPALAGIDTASDFETGVRLAALLATGAIGATVARNGKIIFTRFEIGSEQLGFVDFSGSRNRIVFDYIVELGFDTGDLIGLRTTAPMRLKYKNVKIIWDLSKQGWEQYAVEFDTASIELVSAGTWVIDGPLGQLVQIADMRTGFGSTWIELDLTFALDLGIVKLSGATVRVELGEDGVSVELRGLTVAIDIPNAVKGEGRLRIGDGGSLKAAIEVSIVPAKVKGKASLALLAQPDFTFVALEFAVQFPVGIPLGGTGLAIHGFKGRFVANGARVLNSANPDPIARELAWYRVNPENKFGPAKGQWALGIGVVVGTLPDASFTFSAEGMFTIAFPDLAVILGITANFISVPDTAPKDQKADAESATLKGLLVLDRDGIRIAIEGRYLVPKILDVAIPVGANFPIANSANPEFFIRIGSDGVTPPPDRGLTRFGDPVRAIILPDILNIKGWSYTMVEERYLYHLGNDSLLNFDGFSLGFGAGIGIDWSAGPIKLSASAELLVGMGVNPVCIGGALRVRGELSLVVLSISVSGRVTAIVCEDFYRVEGEFCGEVDMFFFSIKGCVGVKFGSTVENLCPPAPPPVKGVALVDPFGNEKGKANDSGPGATVWPDTNPLLQFAHNVFIDTTAGDQFIIGEDRGGPIWSGSTELKYAYRLRAVRLKERASGTLFEHPEGDTLKAVWWLPRHRKAIADSDPDAVNASEHEGRSLSLLDWELAPWARVLDDSQFDDDIPGDPTGTIEDVCGDAEPASPACVYGALHTRTAPGTILMQALTRPSPPYDERFVSHGRAHIDTLSYTDIEHFAQLRDLELHDGQLSNILGALPTPDPSITVTQGYRIPELGRHGGFIASLDFTQQFGPALVRPQLLILVCTPIKRGQLPKPNNPERDSAFEDDDTTCFLGPAVAPGTRPRSVGEVEYGKIVVTPMRGGKLTLAPHQISDVGRPGRGIARFGTEGARVSLNETTDCVVVHTLHGTKAPVEVIAQDARGLTLAKVKVERDGDPRTGIARFDNTPGIKSLIISGGANEEAIVAVCTCISGRDDIFGDVPLVDDRLTGADHPMVVGQTKSDKEFVWELKERFDVTLGNTKCSLQRYAPAEAQDDLVWRRVRIPRQDHGHLVMIELCGVSEYALWQQQQDQDTRDELEDNINDHSADPTDGNVDGTPRRPILKLDTEYEIEVDWDYACWQPTLNEDGEVDPTDTPPIVDTSLDWKAGITQRFRFRTAREQLNPPTTSPPGATRIDRAFQEIEFFDETRFDPHYLVRYLAGLEPDGVRAPHFLDDPLFAHFHVNYLEQLANSYGRTIVIKFKRTDPAPGSAVDAPLSPIFPDAMSTHILARQHMAASDVRILDAMIAAPCLDPGPVGGSTTQIHATLAPEARYDLIVYAPPSDDPDNESFVVARSHFSTSRYPTPQALIADCGFPSAGPANPTPPRDVIIDDVPPFGGVLRSNDKAFEQALRDLGLDPWPISPRPRATPMWVSQTGQWLIAGLLLESQEPLDRRATLKQPDNTFDLGDRLRVEGIRIDHDAAAVNLDLVRSNAAGTRFLFAARGGPAALIGARAEIVLRLFDGISGGVIEGRRTLLRTPRSARMEGLA